MEDENGQLLSTDPPSPPATMSPSPTTLSTTSIVRRSFLDNLPSTLEVFLGHNGKAYSIRHDRKNLYVLEVGSRALNIIIREIAQEEGHRLRKHDLHDINELLLAYAERAGIVRQIWYRVAPIEHGVVIDTGNDQHTRIRITAGKVEIIESGCEILFYRTPYCLPMAMPQEGFE